MTGVGATKGAFRDLNLGHLDTLLCGSRTVSEDKLKMEKKSKATHIDSEYDLLRLLMDIDYYLLSDVSAHSVLFRGLSKTQSQLHWPACNEHKIP